MDEFNREIEKFWREKFAQEVESCLMNLENDEITLWFNRGIQHAANFIRHFRDD
jgi:hypothetical protein